MNGPRLAAARRAAGLRQLDLARAVGVTRSAVSRWERGLDEPTPDRAERITRALGREPVGVQ